MHPIKSEGARPHIIAVGQIPPPMTGFAYITSRTIDALNQNADIKTIDVSPGDRSGAEKHLHKSRQTLRACWLLARSMKEARIAYLACEGDWGLVYTATLVLIARALGYSIFLHHHAFSYIDHSSTLMRLIVLVGGRKIRHIFLCSTMLHRFENRYGDTPDPLILSNAAFVESASSYNEASDRSKPLRIGLLSNLTREKGLYTFLQLVRTLKDKGADIQAVLAGPIANPEDAMNVAAAENELGGTLKVLGPLYDLKKEEFYRKLDVFVFPTQYANEAQPTVLFEALAAGARVVAFNRGCISNQVGQDGLVISPSEDFLEQASIYLETLIAERAVQPLDRLSIVDRFRESRAASIHVARNLIANPQHPIATAERVV